MDSFFNFKSGKKILISVRQPDVEMRIVKMTVKCKYLFKRILLQGAYELPTGNCMAYDPRKRKHN